VEGGPPAYGRIIVLALRLEQLIYLESAGLALSIDPFVDFRFVPLRLLQAAPRP
jgi:hypothetical protein